MRSGEEQISAMASGGGSRDRGREIRIAGEGSYFIGKSLFDPPNYGGSSTLPPNYETV
jgi:hypothetical protein